MKRTVDELGGLDVLVNNIAYQEPVETPEELTAEQWEKAFRTNVHSYFWTTQSALPHLPDGGSIINTSSINGLRGNKSLIDYSATKGAIHAFTKALAQSLVEKKIRVNCVAPGPIWTPFIPTSGPPEKTAKHGQDVPMGRPGQPEEVAPAYVFFASNADSSYISGEVIAVLGGKTTAG